MTELEIFYDCGNYQQTLIDDIVLDENAILPGSLATYGAYCDGTPIEVFGEPTKFDKNAGVTWLEIYPLDKRNDTIMVGVYKFDFNDDSIKGIIRAALTARARSNQPITL